MEIGLEQLSFSVAQTARLIGKTELATRRMIERGQLPARRAGRRIMILRADLEVFLAALPARGPEGAA